MPRGKNAKAARAHNRACKNGRTSKNTASGSSNQINGKKYKKGESVENTSYTIRETSYEGKIYYIAYLFISKTNNTILLFLIYLFQMYIYYTNNSTNLELCIYNNIINTLIYKFAEF